jgi:hypothetical protein
MLTDERLDSLRAKHASLERAIEEENQRPLPDELKLHELKREKLRIKDQIAELSG